MRAGKLDKKITIQQKTTTRDATTNQPQDTWSTFVELQAQRLEPRPTEQHTANQNYAQEEGTWRTRYVAGITPLMRISYGGSFYEITGVREIERKKGLHIDYRVQANS